MLLLPSSLCLSVTACAAPRTNSFCQDVTWNASLPLDADALDRAAKADYQQATIHLSKPGGSPPSAFCLESWKALQCASKFPKCTWELPAQKVCRSLCHQFADACNASDAVLARCSDPLLYSDPPCSDYASYERLVISSPFTLVPGGAVAPTWELRDGGVQRPMTLPTAPAQLYRTAAGLPVFFALVVLCLHALCCTAQAACGGGGGGAIDRKRPARDAVQSVFSGDGERLVQ